MRRGFSLPPIIPTMIRAEELKPQDMELLRAKPKISESNKEFIRWRNAKRLFHPLRQPAV
jgi:hypothetical protein